MAVLMKNLVIVGHNLPRFLEKKKWYIQQNKLKLHMILMKARPPDYTFLICTGFLKRFRKRNLWANTIKSNVLKCPVKISYF